MPYPTFDRNRLLLKPLAQRRHDMGRKRQPRVIFTAQLAGLHIRHMAAVVVLFAFLSDVNWIQ